MDFIGEMLWETLLTNITQTYTRGTMALQGYMAALMLVIRRDLIIGLEMASTPVEQLLKTHQEMVEKDMKCKYNLFLITILQNKAKNS
jgi:hypothetical protein